MTEFAGAAEVVKAAATVGLTALLTNNATVKDFAVNAGMLVDAVDRALQDGDVEQAKAFLAGEADPAAYVAAYLDKKYGENRDFGGILRKQF